MQPNNRNTVKLGTLLNSVSETHKFEKKELIFLNTSDIHLGKILHRNYSDVAKLPGQAKKSVQVGDILFSEIRPANGRWAILSGDTQDLVVSTKLMVLRTNLELAIPEFMYFYLTSSEITSKLQAIAEYRSATFPQITFEQVSDLEIDLPTIEEQKVIIHTIESIDDKIAANLGICKTLEDIAHTLFKSLFIDFEPVKSKMASEAPRSLDASLAQLFPDSMETSELGLIPKGWKVANLDSLSLVRYGAPFASKLFNSLNVGQPLIRIRDLKKQTISTWSPENHPRGFIVSAGQLLVGMDGEFNPTIWFGEDALVNQRICKIEPKDWVSSLYVYFTLIPIMRRIEHGSTGSTVIHLGKSDIDAIRLVEPPQEILAKYKTIVEPMLNQMVSLNNQVRILQDVRDALLPRLISGEIQIPKEMMAS